MNRRRVTPPRPAAAAALLIALTLVACGPAGGSVSPSVGASPSEAEPTATSQASPTPEPTTQATDDLGAFVCDLPIDGDGTVTRAQITDVRIGTHAGYDRIVIEFDEGIPPFILDQATPPLLADPSGMEMDVEGDAYWSLVLQGGTRVGLDGSMTYNGQTDFTPTPEFPALAELVEAGDFEAVSSWYIGLHEASCARVLTLADPSRLVIDIQHP